MEHVFMKDKGKVLWYCLMETRLQLGEVSMVSTLKHDNFVELCSYYVEGNTHVLAYEFILIFEAFLKHLIHTTMANFNMNTTSGFSHILGSSTKIPMLIPEYYEPWADRMDDYPTGLDEDLWRCVKSGNFLPSMLTDVGIAGCAGSSIDVTTQTNKFKANYKRCIRELQGALPLIVYNYVRGYSTAKEIWDTLNEKYKGSEKTKKSPVKQCFLELGEFKQKEGGPLALMSKVTSRDAKIESTENDGLEDVGLIVNSDDEAMAFYSNNKVKKIFKKPFNSKSKTSESKGSLSRKIVREEKKVEKKGVKYEDAKTVKKLKGDSGFDSHYCNGANHMASDCMLRKREEKKNRVKYEAYYLERHEEIRAKTKGVSLVGKGSGEEDGTYQIWSSRSDNGEMQNSMHGAILLCMPISKKTQLSNIEI
uniref:Serine-threonine/tyrosine-protein kinase catalytic domain-containing protein n=1 Tax=Lactuca sativa TaxID=4236 RepID=A0A9R1VTX5_LACSA|nr:hypothetical protein LSAT_V11C400159680 [Lactuca sativa]